MTMRDAAKEKIHMIDLGELSCHSISHHYRILEGIVDLFLSPVQGKDKGKRYPVGRLGVGGIVVGLQEALSEPTWALIASGTPDAILQAMSWEEVAQAIEDETKQEAILQALSIWKQQFIAYLNIHKIKDNEEANLRESIDAKYIQTRVLNFYRTIYPQLLKATRLDDLKELQHAKNLKKIEEEALKRSYQDMLSILGEIPVIHKSSAQDTLTPCMAHVAEFYEMIIPEHHAIRNLEDVTQATGIQFREINLSGEWWRTATSPLLLQSRDEKYFCIALPRRGGYELIDPANQVRERLIAEKAKMFKAIAWQAYRPLPQKKLDLRSIVPFSFWGAKLDLLRLGIVGSLAALLSLATPWFTGYIFDYVVPNGEKGQLLQILLALVVAAFAAGLFELVRAISVLRLSGKMNLNLEIGIWDRLIRLPVGFFKQFTTGELTIRAMAASGMRHVIAGVAISSILSGVFSLFSFILLFYYDVKLALIATGGTLLLCGFTIVVSLRQFSYYKVMQDKLAKLSGMVVQLLTGIAKIQAGGKEKMAFAQWANRNTAIKSEGYHANWLNATLATFNVVWLPLLSLLIFAYISRLEEQLSLGSFLAFNAALGQFTAGMVGLTNAFSAVIQSIPMLKQMMPIIERLPEVHSGKTDPGELSGKIEVNDLVFRYAQEGPMILKGVSFIAEAGQYIAITGPSGSGKSTLFRLLLGFEQALQGSIFFDEHDMAQLNPQRVRQQCGVVLQNSMLMPGSLFENIVGSAPLTLQDAMQAAERAGMRADIEAMPMGMHTMVSERGGTLSGGQRQRVLIARALARNPKILFFDEATSALDNRTQSIVIRSLEALAVTRIVIAHRLTTIQKADLILVMDNGELVQQGTYSQLMSSPGLFKQMAERQLAEE
ncbi:NHLP bacteriocin export ABC transporter permease/ATPase subunit [Legionella nagasakiensis]|uniref:NHLP bacteriocin export ABC transporter permease/ATPase subunit n=1 Tax=Legionella nagasakiensis TaxID=535290 RepID=UPI0010553748|nr:NHLP bacteriocin export ABC transporter permease/ATPase subunit [Legionella nagasakiensis]